MKRDWDFILFTLEAVESSPTPHSSLRLAELIDRAKIKFGDTQEVSYLTQSTVLQLWRGGFLEVKYPKLTIKGMSAGDLSFLTWEGYDLLEARRALSSS